MGNEFFLTKLICKEGKKQKNLKGVFFTDKMGVKKFVFMNAMIFVFRTFMKNTPL